MRISLPVQYREDNPFVSARLKEYAKWYSENYAVDTYAYKGVMEALIALAEEGYKFSMLSNNQDRQCHPKFNLILLQFILASKPINKI